MVLRLLLLLGGLLRLLRVAVHAKVDLVDLPGRRELLDELALLDRLARAHGLVRVERRAVALGLAPRLDLLGLRVAAGHHHPTHLTCTNDVMSLDVAHTAHIAGEGTLVGGLDLDVEHPEGDEDELHGGVLHVVEEARGLEPQGLEPPVELLPDALLLQQKVRKIDAPRVLLSPHHTTRTRTRHTVSVRGQRAMAALRTWCWLWSVTACEWWWW